MKNSNIKNINKLGKVCSILSLIAMICCIVGSCFLIFANVFVFALPLDKLNLSGKADATVTMAVDSDSLNGFTLNINDGNDISFHNGVELLDDDDLVSVDGDKIDFGGIWSMDIKEVVSDGNSTTFTLEGDLATVDTAAAKRKMIFNMLEGLLKVAATAVILGISWMLFKEFAKCETPFTEVIVKKMKVFGWSMIAYAFIAGVSLNTVAVGLAILMLAYVFAHGAELQKESDETL